MKIKRAIISVSDKTGLVPFAKTLAELNVELFSTGGTLALLHKEKVPACSITELTGFPEILDGRVKTLHPKVHGGLLFLRSDRIQTREAKKHGILPIDLIVVNLYPFRQTITKPQVSLEEAVEQIDIGGPTMLRSAAKNFESVTVVSDPNDYPAVMEELEKGKGAVSLALRQKLAGKVFRHTAAYDAEIARYLSSYFDSKAELPSFVGLILERKEALRYGENPHQRAALYQIPHPSPLPKGEGRDEGGCFSFEQIQGKQLSYNNILDFEAAADVLREFRQPAACVVKHNNPCGIAEDDNISKAVAAAIDSDPLSAFGGIVGLNQNCDERLAKLIFEKLSFFEVVIAPHFSAEAVEIFKSRKNVRVIRVHGMDELDPLDIRVARSGVLIQDRDRPIWEHESKLKKELKWVTKSRLGASEVNDLIFAWKCTKVVKSNAIVLTRGKQTVGIGGGQMSRVDSVRIACMKAGARTRGAFLASDGFFPMPDNIDVAHEHGIRAVIQPGGSIRDQEVIDACDRHDIAMCFTGERHFRH